MKTFHQLFQKMSDGLYVTVSTWPKLRSIEILALIAGIAACAVHCLGLRRTAAWANKMLAIASHMLKARIRQLAIGGHSLTPEALKREALQVQDAIQCPVLSFEFIQEAVRTLDLEENDRSPYRVIPPRIQTAIALLKAATPAIRPMSIADTNRMYAYCLFVFVSGVMALYLQLWGTRYPDSQMWRLLVLTLPVVQLAIGALNLRAERFWKTRFLEIQENQIVALRRPRAWDVYLYIATSNSYFVVHILAGPFFETLLFGVVPNGMIPLLLVLGTYKAATFLGIHDEVIRSLILTECTLSMALALYIGFVMFGNLHQYKYLKVRCLRGKLRKLEKQIDLYKFGIGTWSRSDSLDYASTCHELWTITGLEIYWDLQGRLTRLGAPEDLIQRAGRPVPSTGASSPLDRPGFGGSQR